MSATSLIVVGASSGGMPALLRLVEQLPAALPAALLVAMHLPPDRRADLVLARIAQSTYLKCHLPKGGEELQNGVLYLAPPDRHLLVKDGLTLLTVGPRENRSRPSIDALFRSAAVEWGPKVAGVMLSGLPDDGISGLEFIKRCEGNTILQDPDEPDFTPSAVPAVVAADQVIPVSKMGPALFELATSMSAAAAGGAAPEDLKTEAAIAEQMQGSTESVAGLGELTSVSCPECGGSLWHMNNGSIGRFRCHTGHAFSAAALLRESRDELEDTLWAALRLLEEQRVLLSRLVSKQQMQEPTAVAEQQRFNHIKQELERLRESLVDLNT